MHWSLVPQQLSGWLISVHAFVPDGHDPQLSRLNRLCRGNAYLFDIGAKCWAIGALSGKDALL